MYVNSHPTTNLSIDTIPTRIQPCQIKSLIKTNEPEIKLILKNKNIFEKKMKNMLLYYSKSSLKHIFKLDLL